MIKVCTDYYRVQVLRFLNSKIYCSVLDRKYMPFLEDGIQPTLRQYALYSFKNSRVFGVCIQHNDMCFCHPLIYPKKFNDSSFNV